MVGWISFWTNTTGLTVCGTDYVLLFFCQMFEYLKFGMFPGTTFVLFIMATTGKLFSLYLDNYANRIWFLQQIFLCIYGSGFIFMAQILIIGAVVNCS